MILDGNFPNHILGVSGSHRANVAQWVPAAPNSNTSAIPATSYAANTGPALLALNGGSVGSAMTSRESWITSPSPGGLTNALPASTGAGAAARLRRRRFREWVRIRFQGRIHRYVLAYKRVMASLVRGPPSHQPQPCWRRWALVALAASLRSPGRRKFPTAFWKSTIQTRSGRHVGRASECSGDRESEPQASSSGAEPH